MHVLVPCAQLFDDQLEVWNFINQKSTVIPPSLMVLFISRSLGRRRGRSQLWRLLHLRWVPFSIPRCVWLLPRAGDNLPSFHPERKIEWQFSGDSDSGIGYGYGGGNYDRSGGAGVAALFTRSGVWPTKISRSIDNLDRRDLNNYF